MPTQKKCKLWFCDEDHYAKDLCNKHYNSQRRNGSPISPYRTSILKANMMVSLGRQIISGLAPHVQDEGYKVLIDRFLTATSGAYLKSEIPACEECGKKPTLFTDGATFILLECDCKSEAIPIEQFVK